MVTTELRSRGKRSDEQATYSGMTRKQTIEIPRYYAFVTTADGEDLVESLSETGWLESTAWAHRCPMGAIRGLPSPFTNLKMR